jgi:hypothetical protein
MHRANAMQYAYHNIRQTMRRQRSSDKRRRAVVHDMPVQIFRHRQELLGMSEAELRVRGLPSKLIIYWIVDRREVKCVTHPLVESLDQIVLDCREASLPQALIRLGAKAKL